MTVSDTEALIRARLEKLVAYRDENDNGLTQQAMADALNKEGILSLSGQAWSKYSIRRILKKLDLNSPTQKKRPGQSTSNVSSPLGQPEEEPAVEHKLKQSSPLMQWNYYESIRDTILDLMKKHGSEGSLVKKLNKTGILTADGSPWNEAAVSRVLRVLQPASSVQHPDDLIREQIKEGRYDTDEERFICVREKSKQRGKSKAKQKATKGTEQKKKEKRKNKKKK